MATETFVIQIRQDGAQSTAAAIDRIGASAQKSANTLAFFRKALVVFSTIRIAENVVAFADAATRMSNRLQVATKSAAEFTRAMEFMKKVSKESRTDLEGNVTIYSRLLRSTEGLKFTTSDLEKAMEGLTYAVKVGGATSMEARNSLIQFSQSLASGALRGDELRSVAEQLPALASAIGKEFGISGGALLAFAKANPGILETEKVVRAVIKASAGLKAEAAKMAPTMMEGFIAIKNAFLSMLWDFNTATGAFGLVSKGLVLIADNIVALSLVVTILTGVWAAHFIITSKVVASAAQITSAFIQIARATSITTASMAFLNAVMMINPFVLAAVAIAAFVATLVTLYQTVPAVKVFIDDLWASFKSLASTIYGYVAPAIPVLSAAFGVLTAAIGVWMEVAGTVVSAFLSIWKAIYQVLESLGVTTFAWEAFKVILTGVGVLMLGMFLGAINTVAFALGLLSSALNAVGLVSDAQNAKVQAATTRLHEYSAAVMAMSLGLPDAAEKLAALNTKYAEQDAAALKVKDTTPLVEGAFSAVAQASLDAADPLGKLTKEMLAVAPASTELAIGTNKSYDGLVKLDEITPEAMEKLKKLNPELFKGKENGEAAASGYGAATAGMRGMETQARATIKALQDLAAAQAKVSGGSAMNSLPTRAAGGPVTKGQTYLVGERGPELFTANSSGQITPNHQLLGSTGSSTPSAANDNDSSARMIVGAMSMVAETVSDSNIKLIQVIKKNTYTMSQWTGGTGYKIPTGSDIMGAVSPGSNIDLRQRVIGRARSDGSMPLPGDADYVENRGFKTWVGGINGPVVTAVIDKNDPTSNIRAGGIFAGALGNEEMAKAMYASAEKILQTLRDVRDNTANFKQFKEMLKADMAAGGPKIDFQTLLPMLGLGGTSYPTSDPYGVGNWPTASNNNSAASNNGGGSSEPPVTNNIFNIGIATPNVQQFRENMASVEGRILGAVKRAQKRAGA